MIRWALWVRLRSMQGRAESLFIQRIYGKCCTSFDTLSYASRAPSSYRIYGIRYSWIRAGIRNPPSQHARLVICTWYHRTDSHEITPFAGRAISKSDSQLLSQILKYSSRTSAPIRSRSASRNDCTPHAAFVANQQPALGEPLHSLRVIDEFFVVPLAQASASWSRSVSSLF